MEYVFTSPTKKLYLQVAGKFNVVLGHSGTGKSYLCRLAEQIRTTHGYSEKQPMVIAGVPDKFNLDVLSQLSADYEGALIIVDECFDLSIWHAMIREMMAGRNYYIVCTREGNAAVPYGVDNTFVLEMTKDAIRMLPAYPRRGTVSNPSSFTSIIIEDSKLGHEVVRSKTHLPVYTSSGKEGLCHKLRQVTGRALVLFDACGIGQTYPALLESAKSEGAILYDSNSFEWEVLRTIFSNIEHTSYFQECLYYSSEEEYYVKTLSRVLNTLYKLHYVKSSQELASLLILGKGVVNGNFVDLADFGAYVSKLYPFLNAPTKANTATTSSSISDMKLL